MPGEAVGAVSARGDRPAERRKAAGLIQQALAEELGVERSTVVRWKRGETGPAPWTRLKLAKALRIDDRTGEAVAHATSATRATPPANCRGRQA